MAMQQLHRYSRRSGFWIRCADPPEILCVHDHLLSVEADPHSFGLTLSFIQLQRVIHSDPPQHAGYRTAVLLETMTHGFVRVRGHGFREPTTFQYHSPPGSHAIMEAILWFKTYVHMADDERICLADVRIGSVLYTSCGKLRDYGQQGVHLG